MAKMESDGWKRLDPELRATGEAVARLAVELAKAARKDGEGFNPDDHLKEAWKLLRHACLWVDATGRKHTIEDYKRLRVKPSNEVWEQIKPPEPPPPEPERKQFSELYNKKQDTIPLKGPNEEGKMDSFEWKQCKPYDPTNDDEKKTSFYRHALALAAERVDHSFSGRGWNRDELIDMLCSAWLGDEHDIKRLFVTGRDEQGYYKYSIRDDEALHLVEAANHVPRPNNALVRTASPFRRRPILVGDQLQWPEPESPYELLKRSHTELAGPPPRDDASVEEIRVELEAWANEVLEAWKQRLVNDEFERFYIEGQEQGFLWEDVVALARLRTVNKGGIKWKSQLKGSKSE